MASISPEDGIACGSSGITRGEQEGKQAVRRGGRNVDRGRKGNTNRTLEVYIGLEEQQNEGKR